MTSSCRFPHGCYLTVDNKMWHDISCKSGKMYNKLRWPWVGLHAKIALRQINTIAIMLMNIPRGNYQTWPWPFDVAIKPVVFLKHAPGISSNVDIQCINLGRSQNICHYIPQTPMMTKRRFYCVSSVELLCAVLSYQVLFEPTCRPSSHAISSHGTSTSLFV